MTNATQFQLCEFVNQLDRLTDREKWVLRCRILGYPLQTIANQVPVTKERIRQIESKGLRKMRWYLKKIYEE